MGTNERLVHANGVDLCVETFGDADDPAILLISGGAASMDWWEDAFCERLARGGRFVIRYDFRDTGRSVSYEPGSPRYTQDDLVDDAVALLDVLVLGLASAHVVGISMGGSLAQVMAVDHPGRVASLTLMSTSPGGPGGPERPDLPPMSTEVEAYFAGQDEPDWNDREAVIEHFVEADRPFRGAVYSDDDVTRRIAGRVFDRSVSLASGANHALMESGRPARPRLGEVKAPTLVIHGTEDPLFPYGHAIALADEIPGARLVPLAGVGHQMPPRETWDVVVAALLEHTSRDG